MLGRNVHTAQRTFTRREALEGMGACAMMLALRMRRRCTCRSGILWQQRLRLLLCRRDRQDWLPFERTELRCGNAAWHSGKQRTLCDLPRTSGLYGRDVELRGAAPALHEALISGDLDLVDYAGFAGILGKSKGIDTTAIAVTQWGSG